MMFCRGVNKRDGVVRHRLTRRDVLCDNRRGRRQWRPAAGVVPMAVHSDGLY